MFQDIEYIVITFGFALIAIGVFASRKANEYETKTGNKAWYAGGLARSVFGDEVSNTVYTAGVWFTTLLIIFAISSAVLFSITKLIKFFWYL